MTYSNKISKLTLTQPCLLLTSKDFTFDTYVNTSGSFIIGVQGSKIADYRP